MSEMNVYPPFKASTFGRPLKFQPKKLLEKFEEYVEWCKEHPIVIEKSEAGKSGETAFNKTTENKVPRLVTIEGFFVYLGCSANWVWWSQLEKGTRGEEFSKVKAAIKGYCEQYQKEMASAGVFNANIVSRLLGLADKKAVEAAGEGITIVVRSEEEKDKLQNINELGV